MSKTTRHPNAIGNGDLGQVFPESVHIADLATDAQALNMLYLTFSPEVAEGLGTGAG